MRIIVAITCLCGTIGLGQGCEETRGVRPVLLDAADTKLAGTRPGRVTYDGSPVVSLSPRNDVDRADINGTYRRNLVLVSALKSSQDNLAFTLADDNNKQKDRFTKISYFLLHYYEAETGNFFLDLAKAAVQLNKVRSTPASVVAAPVRALTAKFVAAVANRIGAVYAFCDLEYDCGNKLENYDSLEKKKCYQYFQNVLLHQAALERADNVRRLVEFVTELSKDLSRDLVVSLKSELGKLAADLKAIKEVYQVLKSHNFPCSYNVEVAETNLY